MHSHQCQDNFFENIGYKEYNLFYLQSIQVMEYITQSIQYHFKLLDLRNQSGKEAGPQRKLKVQKMWCKKLLPKKKKKLKQNLSVKMKKNLLEREGGKLQLDLKKLFRYYYYCREIYIHIHNINNGVGIFFFKLKLFKDKFIAQFQPLALLMANFPTLITR